MKFCPTLTVNPHQLELVEHPNLYACTDCQALYELQDNKLVPVEFRLVYNKDPFFLAGYQREEREKYRALVSRLRNDKSIQVLRRQAQVGDARK